jgi:excisionase family DNA binding protein
MTEDRLLTADEVATLLSVPVGWVREQTRAGNLPHLQLGRYRRYREADLRAYLESVTQGGGPGWRKHRPQLAAAAEGSER